MHAFAKRSPLVLPLLLLPLVACLRRDVSTDEPTTSPKPNSENASTISAPRPAAGSVRTNEAPSATIASTVKKRIKAMCVRS